MTSIDKMETLKTFASFPAATKYGFAAGYAAAKAEGAAEKAETEEKNEEERPT